MKMSEQEWDAVLDTNLKACFNWSPILRIMSRAKKGKTSNISSVVGIAGGAGQVNYAASKAGMIGFTKALAKELTSRNICVNCIAPGFITTRMTDALPEARKQEILQAIPLVRFGRPVKWLTQSSFCEWVVRLYLQDKYDCRWWNGDVNINCLKANFYLRYSTVK